MFEDVVDQVSNSRISWSGQSTLPAKRAVEHIPEMIQKNNRFTERPCSVAASAITIPLESGDRDRCGTLGVCHALLHPIALRRFDCKVAPRPARMELARHVQGGLFMEGTSC
jgi:hypothetical protein